MEEKGTQISSETPHTIERFGVAVESEREKPREGKQQSSSPSKDDDGSRVGSLDSEANPFLSDEDQTLVRNVQARLRAQYPQTYDRNKDRVDDPLFIREAISMIDERGESAISVPDAYFASGIAKILDCEADLLALSDVLARKEHRRTKFMPGFSPALDAAQEKARQQFNRMVEGRFSDRRWRPFPNRKRWRHSRGISDSFLLFPASMFPSKYRAPTEDPGAHPC